jgi:DNA-binding response OmpR family regulator
VTRSRRILVVDDQPDILELTAAVLEGEGYDVVTVGGADQALDRLDRDAPFDLVLLDVNMPGMDGWEALRMIRADERLAQLPVVMFSVRGEMRDKITGLQEGASDWIPKPFQVDELLFRVRRAIAGPGAGA